MISSASVYTDPDRLVTSSFSFNASIVALMLMFVPQPAGCKEANHQQPTRCVHQTVTSRDLKPFFDIGIQIQYPLDTRQGCSEDLWRTDLPLQKLLTTRGPMAARVSS